MTIGVFDSGVGGLSVWKELVKLMPQKRYLYVSDGGYCPYGPRPKEYIIERTRVISRFLIGQGADIIVVACNTATAAAIKTLREEFDIDFVGMEPAVKPAALRSRSGVVGVLATRGTFKGELYLGTLHKFASNIKVIEQIGDGLVELVEQGRTESEQAEQILAGYLEPMIEAGADHVVLGCTHYPFLEKAIGKVSAGRLTVVNPAPAIAKRTCELLENVGCKGIDEGKSGSGCRCNEVAADNMFYTTGSNLILMESMVNAIVKESGLDLCRANCFSTIEI